MSEQSIDPTISTIAKLLGMRGGSRTSAAKKKSSRLNLQKANRAKKLAKLNGNSRHS